MDNAESLFTLAPKVVASRLTGKRRRGFHAPPAFSTLELKLQSTKPSLFSAVNNFKSVIPSLD